MSPLTREQQQLVESALDETTAYARAMAKRLGLVADDLVGEVHAELVAAAQRVDLTRDTRFIGYAFPGVKGAILDAAARERGMRAWSLAGRALRRQFGDPEEGEKDENIQISLEPVSPRAASVEGLRGQLSAIAGALALASSRPDGDSEMVDALFQRRVAAQLDDCVAALPPGDRQLVRYRFHEDRTLVDTAAALGVSSRTVQRRESEVVRKLGLKLRAVGLTAGVEEKSELI